MMTNLALAIIDSLSSDLLKKGFSGHCYVASEAYYHLAGGKSAGLKAYTTRILGSTHWFLKTSTGAIIDLTIDQFDKGVRPFICKYYADAHARGFLTKKPSKRAQIVMARAGERLNNETA